MPASTLKIIALITMIIDHIGAVFFPQYLFLRMIGRIAFPIYAFFVAKGCEYTKNKNKYLIRLLIFALIAEIPYDLCFNNFNYFSSPIQINFLNGTNTIYTMFLGALAIFSIKYIFNLKINIYLKYFINFIILVFILILAVILHTDYSMWGILLILVFYYFKESKKLMCLFATLFIFIIFRYLYFYDIFLCLFNIFPIFLIYFYNNKKGLSLKWLFYIAYPLHLMIIALIKFILDGNI